MVATKVEILLVLLAGAQAVYGHCAITSATGDAGGSGMALGVNPNTPRDGSRRRPFQQDSTRFDGDAAETFGETLAAGDNDPESGTAAILAMNGGDQLPQITQGGSVDMTVHQVNEDGAGPFTCMINADGTGETWQAMQVTTQVPGDEDGENEDGEATDFPLSAAVPANQQCTGSVAGQDNVCMVRCENPAGAGPFGGVVPVQLVQNGANTNTANTNTVDTNSNDANTNTANGNTANSNTANTNSANTNSASTNSANTNSASTNSASTNSASTNSANTNSANTNTAGVEFAKRKRSRIEYARG